MARINAYEKTTVLDDNDVFLLDGTGGTKNITARNLYKNAAGSLNPNDLESAVDHLVHGDVLTTVYRLIENKWKGYRYYPSTNLLYDIIDCQSNPNNFRYYTLGLKKKLLRSAKLSNPIDTYADAIQSGSFNGLFLGDYWDDTTSISGKTIRWRIVDFDYWWGVGDTGCSKHHITIMPDASLYNASMNDTDTTKGGYVGSKMYKEGLNQAKEMINNYFGEGNILKHRLWLHNAVNGNGVPSACAWYDSTVEIPSELELFGDFMFGATNNGSNGCYASTCGFKQLAAFENNTNIFGRSSFWLRDIYSSVRFSAYAGQGAVINRKASVMSGVRPVFSVSFEG